MIAAQNSPLEDTAVDIFEADGEWHVRIVENGGEQVSSFVIETFALAYAEGQRIRLGIGAPVPSVA